MLGAPKRIPTRHSFYHKCTDFFPVNVLEIFFYIVLLRNFKRFHCALCPFLCYKQDIPNFLRDYELQGTPREELNG